MARNPVKRTESVINPAFLIPEGVSELVYPDVFLDGPEVGEVADTGEVPEDTDKPETPDSFKIISQTLIEGKGGAADVVDIVAEVEDVTGVVRYEYRLTKEKA